MTYSSKKRVILGVSGGIDSAVASFLLREQGFEVIALYMAMTDDDFINSEERATTISKNLGLDVKVFDARAIFHKEVFTPFINSYIEGETPSPCTWCNQEVKWQILYQQAQKYNCQKWATGHYCQKEKHSGNIYIKRGVDNLKDQSYYLWSLSQEILSGALMPLGGYLKSQVRDIAATITEIEYLRQKKESMSLCFLKGKSYHSLIKERYTPQSGDIVDGSGNKIASHSGYPLYTIAQRKGLDIPQGCCITKIDKETNTIKIGTPQELYHNTFYLREWRATNPTELFTSKHLSVIVRGIGRNPQGYCTVETEGDLLKVVCENPAWALTKGQPAIFYIDDRVVGGGYLEHISYISVR